MLEAYCSIGQPKRRVHTKTWATRDQDRCLCRKELPRRDPQFWIPRVEGCHLIEVVRLIGWPSFSAAMLL